LSVQLKEDAVIVHTLWFSFKDDVDRDRQAEVLATMKRTASLESVSFGTVGRYLGDPAAGYTHAYCVGLEDLASLERYLYDPVHLAGDPAIIPYLARLAIGPDLTDDADPELGAKIMHMNQRKLQTYPEWAQLMQAIPELDIRIA
jgi:hypothetical protein